MRRSTFILIATLCSSWAAASAATSDPQAYADAFVRMLKTHQFELASREFYYPQNYTSEELAGDQASIAKHLAALFGEIGDLQGEPEYLAGLKLTLFLGVSGGDRSHPTPEVDDAEKIGFGYGVQAQHYGSVRIMLDLVYLQGRWHVLKLRLGFPATDPDAPTHLKAIIEIVRRST
jgi:hypothetical protein